ncbi:helix-turn-helix domain-containing protein [Candidatus Poriferisocius sp.]|uniref:helix-turn-helix domain-containing protein n=1 Tax=Candidatus Poriferisocius sp. TaxID=3101276 RepID=UPI003B01640F
MPRQRGRKKPNHWAEDGGWPYACLSDDAPPTAHLMQAVARRLREALRYKSTGDPHRITGLEASQASGVSPTTITNIIHGITWPDADSIARLECALDVDLWGSEHRRAKGASRSETDPT